MSDDTIRTKAITYTRDHLKEIAAYAIAVASTVVTFSMAYGHKQADSEIQAKDFREFKEEVKADIRDLKSSVQDVKMNQVSDHATMVIVGSDVHDLKMMADHASDVAESFKVPRLTGHRAKK